MPFKDKETQREYQRDWMRKRREQFFKGKKCIKCSSKDRLELDHIDPKQKISHSIWSWSDARRNAELKKCQVLCYSCHKNKSKTEARRGTELSIAKITEEDVPAIRKKATLGQTKRSLAREYGVDEKAIRALLSGQTWGHVK